MDSGSTVTALLRRVAAAGLLAASLSGCSIVSLTATVAETAVSAAGTAVSAAGTVVTTTGKVIGGAVDAATSSSKKPEQ